MGSEYVFSWSVRRYALLGLLGLLAFVLSLIAVHLMDSGYDWMRDYVSNLANRPLGWVFITGAVMHGWGNLALAQALRGSLYPGNLRSWAALLFSLAAVGILLAALFPVDPPQQLATISGRIHRSAASATFVFELAALFVFSVAFGRHHLWRHQQVASMALSVSAAVAMVVFIIALHTNVAPGLAERVALSILLIWEVWACYHLILPSVVHNNT